MCFINHLMSLVNIFIFLAETLEFPFCTTYTVGRVALGSFECTQMTAFQDEVLFEEHGQSHWGHWTKCVFKATRI